MKRPKNVKMRKDILLYKVECPMASFGPYRTLSEAQKAHVKILQLAASALLPAVQTPELVQYVADWEGEPMREVPSVYNVGIQQGDPYFIDCQAVGRYVGNLHGAEWVCYHRQADDFDAMCAAFAKASGEVAA